MGSPSTCLTPPRARSTASQWRRRTSTPERPPGSSKSSPRPRTRSRRHHEAQATRRPRMRRGLADSIRTRQAAGVMPVLSEIKVRSPKDGDLLRGRDPGELATAMARAGIAGLSIVTAPEDFDGDLELVRRIRRRVDVPILRKDFTREVTDLDETVQA